MQAVVASTCCLLIFILLIANHGESSKLPPKKVTKQRIAKMDGDISIGALFPVHRQPPLKVAFTRQCGEIWEQYGMHRIEILFKTLDKINSDNHLLPNVTLACDIRDSCWYSPVALEQSIDFIKNSIASLEKYNRTEKDNCSGQHEKPIAGLIGPGSSTVSIQVQNLLSLFNIPQIGYSATSKDLSDKSLYKYFLRVVPSDMLQARAMVDLVLHYNWTYISTVYTEGNYGWRGMQEFNEMAKQKGICGATAEKVPNNADDEAYDRVIDSLNVYPNAKVVICFCEGMTVRGLMKASIRKDSVGKFVIIGSDGWAVRPDVVTKIEHAAAGGISFKLYSPPVNDFDEYYFSLSPFTNTRNPWFQEFWQERFHCYLEGADRDERFTKPCTGDEDLREGYVQDAKLGFVVNGIYTMAYALDAMHRDHCRGRPGLCKKMRPINGTVFMHYLLNVSFTSYSNDPIMFNQNGDPPGRYDIMNFQELRTSNGSTYYDYVRIGGWDNGNLTMEDGHIFWPNPTPGKGGVPMVESVCSKPCPRGMVKKAQPGGVACCWDCTSCKDNEFLVDETTCKACVLGWWPNSDLTACLPIEIEHLLWGDTEAVVSMALACLGVVATIWVTVVFMRHNDTAVVKASTRELSYIILLGICISYLTTLPLVAKPSIVTCYLTRILPGLSFSLIYGALVTKTNRIARILAGSKKKIMTRKPRFMSASAQVVITCILIGVECAIITIMLILQPADSMLMFPEKSHVRLTCNATTLGIVVPLGFDTLLIIMCTLYAIKTRNLPENFNEAKFIGFTMYTTCIIWLAFLPIYFGSDNKVITMCLAISLSATVSLMLLFFPKIYIIVCKPERNNRSAFTTSKDVRCHIGSTGCRSFNSTDSADKSRTVEEPSLIYTPLRKEAFEEAALTLYRQKSFFTRWKNKSVKQLRELRGRNRHYQRSVGIQIAVSRHQGAASHVRHQVMLTESGVQTDMDLLEPLLGSLRRRNVPSITQTYCTPKTSLSSRMRRDRALQQDAVIDFYQDAEMELLNLDEHRVEHSPLLLGIGSQVGCDSASEEAISELDNAEEPDDLDELLASACPAQASFTSLEGEKPFPQSSTSPRKSHFPSAFEKPSILKRRRSHNQEPTVGPRMGQSSSVRCNNCQPKILDKSPRRNSNGNPTKRRNHPSGYANTSFVDNMPPCAGTSASVEAIDSVPLASSSWHNPLAATKDYRRADCSSPRHLRVLSEGHIDFECDTVVRFQEYLRSRGLDLDLSTVQSSDV